MANQTNGDSAGIQRLAFPRMYHAMDEGRVNSSVRQLLVSFVDSMDLSWMLNARSLDLLCTHTVLIPEASQERPVHGLLLARKSPFFDALIKCSGGRELRLPFEQCDFLRQCMATIIECLTNDDHSFAISDENCLELYQAADYLLYRDLQDRVLAYIKSVCATNLGLALDIWTFSEHYYLPELNKLTFDQIQYSFTSVIQEDLWLELDCNSVRLILQHSGINCSSELLVMEAASRWLLANWPERAEHGESLLACVRRGLLNPGEVSALLQHEIMVRYPRLQALYRAFPNVPGDLRELYDLHEDLFGQAATPREPHEAVMLFGGWCQEDGPRAACQVFNPRANTWTMWTPNAARPASCIGQVERRVYAGCVFVNDVVHLVGGFDGERALNTVYCYSLRSPGSGWYEGSCMISKRYYVCCAAVDKQIFAIGGHSGETQERFGGRLDSVERMDVEDNSWLPAASMRTVRSDAGAAGLGGRIYVAGGFNGQQYHDTAEMYDPSTDQWTFICRMNFLRGGVSLVCMGKTLYAIGGNDGQTRLAVVEAYQHEFDGWVFSGRLSRQKSNLSTAVLEGGIMIMGGWSDRPVVGILAAVEKFTPSADVTQQMADMAYAASATSACTVYGRDLVARYAVIPKLPNPWLIGDQQQQQQQQQVQQEQQQHLKRQPVFSGVLSAEQMSVDGEASPDTQFIQSSQDT